MPTDEQQANDTVEHSLDEHITAVLVDEKDNELSQFMGVVNSVSAETIDVTYYHRKDKDGTSWTFPDDDSDPVSTAKYQIIFRRITVGYAQTRIVRCSIDKQIARDINNSYVKYINELE